MKNKLSALALAAVLFILPLQGKAESAEIGDKVGIVDIQKIMRDSLAAKNLHTQIEKKKTDFETEIKKQEDELQKTDKDLADQRNVLSAEALDKKRSEFKDRITKVQHNVQTRKAQLEEAYNHALSDIQASVLKITADLAKEKNLALVIPSSQILYAQDKMNISDEVLKRLDKDMPKVAFTIDENIEKEAKKAEKADKAEKPMKSDKTKQ